MFDRLKSGKVGRKVREGMRTMVMSLCEGAKARCGVGFRLSI